MHLRLHFLFLLFRKNVTSTIWVAWEVKPTPEKSSPNLDSSFFFSTKFTLICHLERNAFFGFPNITNMCHASIEYFCFSKISFNLPFEENAFLHFVKIRHVIRNFQSDSIFCSLYKIRFKLPFQRKRISWPLGITLEKLR